MLESSETPQGGAERSGVLCFFESAYEVLVSYTHPTVKYQSPTKLFLSIFFHFRFHRERTDGQSSSIFASSSDVFTFLYIDASAIARMRAIGGIISSEAGASTKTKSTVFYFYFIFKANKMFGLSLLNSR